MPFSKVNNLSQLSPPGRLYEHTAGNEVYSGGNGAREYLLENIKSLPEELRHVDYFISISWGQEGKKLVDFFGYSDIKENWKANPTVFSWGLENGLWKNKSDIACGEGLVLLGREEEHRLSTRNLEEYLDMPLEVTWINSILRR